MIKATYMLALPVRADVHPMFHVTKLKPFVGQNLMQTMKYKDEWLEPVRIMMTKCIKNQRRMVDDILVEWEGQEKKYTCDNTKEMQWRFAQLRTLRQVRAQGEELLHPTLKINPKERKNKNPEVSHLGEGWATWAPPKDKAMPKQIRPAQ